MSVVGFGTSITYGFYDSVYPAPPNPPPDPLVNGYAARTAAALGLGITNYAISGATMNGGPGVGQASILAEALAVAPPNRYEIVLMEAGTNDIIAYGTDPTQLALFSAGLRQLLLWITGNRRVPEPRTERERRLTQHGQIPSVIDGCRVFVGNCPKQSPYSGSASAAAQALYAAQMATDVAYVAGRGRRVYLVDFASAFDPATQSPDGIHPSPAGHASVAAAYLAVIRAHL